MANKFLSFSAALCILLSCNDKQVDQTGEAGADEKTGQTGVTRECFMAVNNKDSVSLQMETDENGVTGKLAYFLFEKDKNSGIIRGKMYGDTLIAAYTFMSEGVSSTREVAFLRKGNGLVEGFGDIEEKNGGIVFANRAAIKFDNEVKLANIDCGR